jgi:large repetitive protein
MISLGLGVPSKFLSLCARLAFLLAAVAGLLLPASLVAQVTFEPNGGPGYVNFGSQAIGSTSAAQTLNFAISGGTAVGSIGVVTLGAPNLDFTDAGGSTCTAKAYGSDTACTVNVKFKPPVAGLRLGAVVFYSRTGLSGTQLASVPISGIGTGPQIAYGPGVQTVVDSGLDHPFGVTVDGAGDVLIANLGGKHVVKVPAGGGAQTTVGKGLWNPSATAVNGAGDVFIADVVQHFLVKVPAGGGAQTTVQGFANPYGVAVDGAGNVFVSDAYTNLVVELPAGGGAQTTVGSGFDEPFGVAVDSAGDVYVADSGNSRVVKVSAGSGGQTTVGSGLYEPTGVAVDGAGDVFIADRGNGRVVEVPAGGSAQTTVGSGFNEPVGVAVDGAGDVFIADWVNGQVVKVRRSGPPTLAFPTATIAGTTDTTDGTKTAEILNIGNQALNFSAALSYPADFSEPSSDSNACISSTSLSAGQECDVPVEFTPQSNGVFSKDVMLTDNNLNGSGVHQNIPVTGTGNKKTPSITWKPAPLVIDSKLTAAQLNAKASVPGKFVYTPAVGTEIKTTTETLKAVFTPTNTTDYNSVTISVPLPVSVIKLSPTSINFGTVKLDSITTKDVTVTNLGPDAVAIDNPVLSVVKNGDSEEFGAENLCPKSLAAHKSCTIKVEFVAGPFYHQQSATLSVEDSSPGSPQTVSLTALTKEP